MIKISWSNVGLIVVFAHVKDPVMQCKLGGKTIGVMYLLKGIPNILRVIILGMSKLRFINVECDFDTCQLLLLNKSLNSFGIIRFSRTSLGAIHYIPKVLFYK